MKPATEVISVFDEMEDSANKTRELYGANEHCYVMDAKTIGNIGRYLNVCFIYIYIKENLILSIVPNSI